MLRQGRVALVTGGARGIGLGIALKLADAGFTLAISGRRVLADIEPALEEIRKLNAASIISKPLTRAPSVKNPREAAAYTFGYNYSVFAHRVVNVLSAVSFFKHHHPSSRLSVVGLAGAGPYAGAAARAQCGNAINQAVINTATSVSAASLTFTTRTSCPAGRSCRAIVPALLALSAPSRTWVAGETEQTLALARSQYQAANAEKNLTRLTADSQDVASAAVQCLLGETAK